MNFKPGDEVYFKNDYDPEGVRKGDKGVFIGISPKDLAIVTLSNGKIVRCYPFRIALIKTKFSKHPLTTIFD